MTENIKDSIEYRVLILEKEVGILKVQQEELKNLREHITELLIRTQSTEKSFADLKEKLDDYKKEMREFREEMKADRIEALRQHREIQASILSNSKDSREENSKAIKDYKDYMELKISHKEEKKPMINLSDSTLQIIIKLIIIILGVVVSFYGSKVV